MGFQKYFFPKPTAKKNYHYTVENFQFSTRQQCKDIVVDVVRAVVVVACVCLLFNAKRIQLVATK